MEGYCVPESTGPGVGLNEVYSCTTNPFSPTPPIAPPIARHVTRFESVPSYPNKLVYSTLLDSPHGDSVHWYLVYTTGSQISMRGVSTS